jgi:hypothetical protein
VKKSLKKSHFFVKIGTDFVSGKKKPISFGFFCNFQTAHNKQVTYRQKIAQFGHSA